MNKKFILVDRVNNIQKEANYVLKFINDSNEYLIYYLDENNSNKQIFVSELIKNSEGKFFLTDIDINDKNRINNIVYNIVIVLPTDANNKNAIEEFEGKYNINISLESINIENQNYLHNSRVAITSEILVNNCINFYNKHLNSNQINNIQNANQIQTKDSAEITTIPNQDNNVVDNTNILTANASITQMDDHSINNQLPSINPQMQILQNNVNNVPIQTAVNNDTNNFYNNDNDNDKNNEGFVINASIIVGTIALLLAVTIVTFTFITIKKMII